MPRMPALFIGHGSPFNLIRDNPFTADLRKLREELEVPSAIVLISAHWASVRPLFTAENNPKQIFDFYGFPQELYDVKYRPPGDPELAKELADQLSLGSSLSHDWGIDHAATIPLVHLFPHADVPVVEMSLAIGRSPEAHYELGRELSRYRDRGVLFIGSGNLIHTFREMAPGWDAIPFEWAVEHDRRQWRAIEQGDVEALVHYQRDPVSSRAFQTIEHYLPMLYILGMRAEDDEVRSVHEGFQHGSISHRSFIVEQHP